MKTLKPRQPPREPVSAGTRDKEPDLAVLTRINHDMRSPLSVILGVFELLQDSTNLDDGERRYVQFGREAAANLLGQADALRLYSALRRQLVTAEPGTVDLHRLAHEQLSTALAGREVTVEHASGPHPAAACDAGYVAVALNGLTDHLASHLPEVREGAAPTLHLEVQEGSHDSTVLQVRGQDCPPHPDIGAMARARPVPGEQSLALINAVHLIELMGGAVLIDEDLPYLRVTLPRAH